MLQRIRKLGFEHVQRVGARACALGLSLPSPSLADAASGALAPAAARFTPLPPAKLLVTPPFSPFPLVDVAPAGLSPAGAGTTAGGGGTRAAVPPGFDALMLRSEVKNTSAKRNDRKCRDAQACTLAGPRAGILASIVSPFANAFDCPSLHRLEAEQSSFARDISTVKLPQFAIEAPLAPFG